MSWIYKELTFTNADIQDNFGFVYRITNLMTDKVYIGKKFFFSIRRKKVKGRTNRKVTKTESDWQDYYGSCKPLLQDIEKFGVNMFKREILSLHKTKGQVNYGETRLLFGLDVLDSDKFYNSNILGRFFKK